MASNVLSKWDDRRLQAFRRTFIKGYDQQFSTSNEQSGNKQFKSSVSIQGMMMWLIILFCPFFCLQFVIVGWSRLSKIIFTTTTFIIYLLCWSIVVIIIWTLLRSRFAGSSFFEKIRVRWNFQSAQKPRWGMAAWNEILCRRLWGNHIWYERLCSTGSNWFVLNKLNCICFL